MALRVTWVARYKPPKNKHLAPRFDTWNEKHEAWVHLRKMAKLAATGFYIPPAWYQHFRMFPPVHHNFTEEKTLNPQNASDETQVPSSKLHPDAEQRMRLRGELARHARSAAVAGNRYLNQFFVKKPIDEMEKHYNDLRRRGGLDHNEALQRVLQAHRERQAIRSRARIIQAEEAQLTGKFITLREAVSLMTVLDTVQKEKLAPQDYATMVSNLESRYLTDPMMHVTRAWNEKTKTPTPRPDGAVVGTEEKETSAAAESSGPVDSSAVTDEEGDMSALEEIITMTATAGDSLPKLREVATDGVLTDDGSDEATWYRGYSPEVSIDPKRQ